MLTLSTAAALQAVDHGDNGLCQVDEGQAGDGVGVGGYGCALAAVVADALHQWQLCQQMDGC